MTYYAIFNNDFFSEKPRWMPSKLYEVVCQRANPRTKQYMLDLLHHQFPDSKAVLLKDIPHTAEEVILLFPDAIGLGFNSLEKKCKDRFKRIMVLNGRKRQFILNDTMKRKLLLRRFLECSFLPELCFMPILLFWGLFFTLKDSLRGRT